MFTEERAIWLYQHFRWLEEQLPRRTHAHTPQLILPTAAFYPHRNTGDHEYAEKVFEVTRAIMGLSDWPCRLEQQTDEEKEMQAFLGRAGGAFGEWQHKSVAGTFMAGEEVVITYAPDLLREPPGLIATFAHELCHYLLAMVKMEPPAGWAEHEPLTDLAAVHEGFGVFLCNNAFNFNQWADTERAGWSTSTRGYLNEAELGFSLGIYCVRHRMDPESVVRFLKPNPGEVFWDSIDFIQSLEKS